MYISRILSHVYDICMLYRFYVGDYALASVKLILFLAIPFGLCLLCCCAVGGAMAGAARRGAGGAAVAGATGGSIAGFVCVICIACALNIWVITDIILFATNDIPDGDGLTLKPM